MLASYRCSLVERAVVHVESDCGYGGVIALQGGAVRSMSV